MSYRFLLASKQAENLHEIYLMLYVVLRLLMMDGKTARNM
jgi:hypothetical protein